MSDLVDVVDAAYPFDYRRLAGSVRVVLGYIGQAGETPHIWTQPEVDAVRVAGKVWAPIHTVPPGAFSLDAGKQAANMMREELTRYAYPSNGPVFLDVERSTYIANPQGARAGIAAWTVEMQAAGHSHAIAYVPAEAGYGWIADWTGSRPNFLLPNELGWQWQGGPNSGLPYDQSVFDPAVFATLLGTEPDVSDLSTADKAWFTAQLETVQANISKKLSAYAYDNDKANPEPYAAAHLSAKLDELIARPVPAPAGEVNVQLLANTIVAGIGPNLAAELVTALARKLA